MRLITVRSLAAALLVAFASQAAATVVQTREHAVRVVTAVSGLEHPWSLAFLPDGRWLVTERPGRLRVVDAAGRLEPTPVAGLPRIDAEGQGGLLDVVLHPQFAVNGWIYWSFSRKNWLGRSGTEVARGRLAGGPGAYRMEQVEVIFQMEPKVKAEHHFGGRLVFLRDGSLIVTLGERGARSAAQKLGDHRGKILRLTERGQPVGDNPFLGNRSARPEVYTLGHRNVQGVALEPRSGGLWAHEHGPQGGDELNLIRAGRNYGWPVITYGVNYVTGTPIGEGTAGAGMEQPVKYWSPSPALSGLAFYEGSRFPRWRGDALLGALKGQALIRVRLEHGRFIDDEFMLQGALPRVRDVRVGPDGLIYLLTDMAAGAILRLEPAEPR